MSYTMYTPLNVWLDPASVTDVVAYIQTYLSENTIYSETEIETIIHDYLIAHPELIGGVQSVNGKTGTVVLSASDINTEDDVTIESVLASLSSQISSIAASVATNTSNITNLTGRMTTAETDLTNLKSSIDYLFNGYDEISASWAIGRITSTGYADDNNERVSTTAPIFLSSGTRIIYDEGFTGSIWYKVGNTYFDTGFSDYVGQDGYYLLSVFKSQSEVVSDINVYINAVSKSATSNLINLIRIVSDNIQNGKNLINRDTVYQGCLIDRNNGACAKNANFYATDYIKVNANETIYKRNLNNWYCAFYDVNKQYVEPLANTNDVTISADGYIRCSFAITNLETAIISRVYPLPNANEWQPSLIDREAREEIEMGRQWSNTIDRVTDSLEIRDANYHAGGSFDLSQYAFCSVRITNNLGVPCTINFYDDRNLTSTTWMYNPDGSFVSINAPVGPSIITEKDFPQIPYLKYFRPIITPAQAPSSGSISIDIVGRK